MDADDTNKQKALSTSGNASDSSTVAAVDSSAPSTATPRGQSAVTQTRDIAIPSEAEDTDLIEKEWVERAKEIVEHTRHDPHEQQKALSLMKADYMKKRYNRDIKVSDQDLRANVGG